MYRSTIFPSLYGSVIKLLNKHNRMEQTCVYSISLPTLGEEIGNEVTIMAGLSVLVIGFSITIEVLVMLFAFNGLRVIPAFKLCASVLCVVAVEVWPA